MKKSKFLRLLSLTSAFVVASTLAQAAETNKTKVIDGWDVRAQLTGGYGSDDVKIGRGSTATAASTHYFDAEVKHVQIWKLKPEINATYGSGFYAEVKGYLGFVDSGQSRLTALRTGNVTPRSAGLDGENAFGASGLVGYNLVSLFTEELSAWSVRPLVGWEYHKLRTPTRTSTAAPGFPMFDPNGSTNWRFRWHGPTAGLGIGWNLDQRHALGVRGMYTWTWFKGDASSVNLDHANRGRALSFQGQYAYQMTPELQLALGFEWSKFKTNGTNAKFGGTTQRLGDTTWDSWTAHAGVVYRFY